jgi:hypothetical protein
MDCNMVNTNMNTNMNMNMNMNKFALVRASDGWVWNVCRWDGETPWNHLPDGIVAIECPDRVGPGWLHIEDEWLPPVPPEQEPLPDPPVEG